MINHPRAFPLLPDQMPWLSRKRIWLRMQKSRFSAFPGTRMMTRTAHETTPTQCIPSRLSRRTAKASTPTG